MVDFALDHDRCMLLARMGMGKSSAVLSAIDTLLIASEVKRALVLAPLRVARSTWPEEATKWAEFAHLKVQPIVGTLEQRKAALRNDRADAYTINYENLPWLVETIGADNWPFDMVVADECFDPSTRITTQRGSKRIDSIAVGDLVASSLGFRKVTHVYRKSTQALVRLHLSDGREVVCTPTHRFRTESGWHDAKDLLGLAPLRIEDVPSLRRAIRHQSREAEKPDARALLQQAVLSQIVGRNPASITLPKTSSQWSWEMAIPERFVEPRCSDARVDAVEAVGCHGEEGRSFHIEPRWQRDRHERVRSHLEQSVGARLGVEPTDQYQGARSTGVARTTFELQAGLRMAGPDDVLGGRRADPQHEAREGAQDQEGRSVARARVDRVENLECRGPVEVWDLEVEEAHDYFAEGCLVHNCTRIKSYRTHQGGVRAQALSDIAHTKTRRWINLTGTFCPNGLTDIWGPTWFIDEGRRLGRTYSAFENRWFGYQRAADAINAHKTRIKRVPFPHAQAEIMGLIKDVAIALNPKDWFDIKQPVVVPVYVELPPAVKTLYRQMEREMFIHLKDYDIEAFASSGKVIKCMQLANGAVYTGSDEEVERGIAHWVEAHEEKLLALEEIVEEQQGEPLLVAYHFKPDLERLKKRFPKGRHINTKRDEDDFKAGLIDVAFVHAQSIGHGVDGFQNVCHSIAFFASDFNLETHDQLIERIGPMRQMQAGFDREVTVYLIMARGTIDETMYERRVAKRGVQDATMEALSYKEAA